MNKADKTVHLKAEEQDNSETGVWENKFGGILFLIVVKEL